MNTRHVETNKSIKRGDRQTRYLAQSVLLEEGGSSGLIRFATLAIAAVVTAFIIWAAITDIDEVAVALGEVVPAGQVQNVQHLEGGIISEILVSAGDIVEAGQVLLRLDLSASLSELEQMQARRVGLAFKAERLRAFASGRQPDFEAVVGSGRYLEMIEDQKSIFESQMVSRIARREVIDKQIEQRKADLRPFDKREANLMGSIKLLREELAMREKLLKDGLTTKVVVLNLKREINQTEGDLSRIKGEREVGQEALKESENRMTELNSEIGENTLTEMGGVTAELAQVRETIAKLRDRVRRLEIKAPVRGIVKGMQTHTTVGGVIPPGGVVLVVVPLGEELVVEARISTRDIGHVRVGLPVTTKVVTYDFSRYGGITGELKDISATTFLDEMTGEPYYRGTVSLDRSYAGFDPERNQVLPGMTVQADIHTGKKTLLQYLLKPVYVAIKQGFHER